MLGAQVDSRNLVEGLLEAPVKDIGYPLALDLAGVESPDDASSLTESFRELFAAGHDP